MTAEDEDYIRDNLRYEPDTGHLFWTKPGPGRNLERPVDRIRSKGYRTIKIRKRRLLAHRVSWFLYYGQWPKNQIDHINGIRDDNRIENLRDVTHQQNMANVKAKGCYFHKSIGKYEAVLMHNRKRMYLGYFDTEEEAQAAYREAVKLHRGDYAYNYEDETDAA